MWWVSLRVKFFGEGLVVFYCSDGDRPCVNGRGFKCVSEVYWWGIGGISWVGLMARCIRIIVRLASFYLLGNQ